MAKKVDTNRKRVVGFIGHAGTGKTTLCEAILFNTKANDRIGSVSNATSVMDYEAEEQKRQYSVQTSFFDVFHKDHQVFLMDMPGNSNFIPEAFSLLPAIGGAVLPVDALDGLKFQTEKVTGLLKAQKIPAIAVINRIDKEHANFATALESVKAGFAIEPVQMQIPIGAEAEFKGVVDLMSNKAYVYADASGKPSVTDIPADLADSAEELRGAMIERLVEGDDEVMMKYLDGGEVSPEELAACLRQGVIKGLFCPVYAASSQKNIGVDLLLDAIVATLPSPLEERPRTVLDPKTGEATGTVAISEDGNFLAHVIKTVTDPFTGRISVIRVFRGHLNADEVFFNVTNRSKEKPGKFFYVRGKRLDQADEACAGDVLAMVKLKEVFTNDTLCLLETDKVKLPELPTMAPMVNLAVHPKKKGEEEKMAGAVYRVLEEDPNLRFWRDEQTKDFILSGVGSSQIDVAMERMKRKFQVEVDLRQPKVPYRETIRGKADVQGKHKKQSGGRGQYGDCYIRVEPKPRGEGFEFVNAVVGGAIPKNFIPAIEKGIVECMEKGELTGNPVQDVRVEVYFGSYHDVDSSEMAFKIAGSLAWKKAMMEANPVILEPIMKAAITVPNECMGDVYGNISSRRGRVLGSEDEGKLTRILAEIPQAESYTLSADLRAMTADRGVFTLTFDHYEEVPPLIAEKVVAEAKKDREEAEG